MNSLKSKKMRSWKRKEIKFKINNYEIKIKRIKSIPI